MDLEEKLKPIEVMSKLFEKDYEIKYVLSVKVQCRVMCQ